MYGEGRGLNRTYTVPFGRVRAIRINARVARVRNLRDEHARQRINCRAYAYTLHFDPSRLIIRFEISQTCCVIFEIFFS